MKSPLLSIITPVYNTAELLPRCIDSVLRQSLRDWELILINDGSTDESLAVCQQYASKDSRIRVISQANAGVSVARNKGLDETRGAYITFLDSDDEVGDPETYEQVISVLSLDPSYSIAQYPYISITTERVYPAKVTQPRNLESNLEILQEWLIQRPMSWVLWDKVFDASVLQGKRFHPGIVMEDNLFLLEVLMDCPKFKIVTCGRYHYQQGEFTQDKWVWSEHKTYCLFVVNNRIMELLLSLPAPYNSIKAGMLRRVTNIGIDRLKTHGLKDGTLRELAPCYKALTLADVCSLLPLSWKERLKILLLKGLLALPMPSQHGKP